MVVSKNSQLGLCLWDRDMLIAYYEDVKSFAANYRASVLKHSMPTPSDKELLDKYLLQPKDDGEILFKEISQRLTYLPENRGSEFYTIRHPNPCYFLIRSTVEKCAEMIRINDNFSCSIFNKINDGEYVYLLGKNEFFRFLKFNGVIRGSFWNRERRVAFEVGFHLDKDKYYFPSTEKVEFNRLVRLMTFIELGDIEIVELPAGRNNGANKKSGQKVTNTSGEKVFIVDSSWNKIIIRTDGFAVRGHFRLQPCGANMADRKLLWIDAFEKHGYKRKAKAEIVHS